MRTALMTLILASLPFQCGNWFKDRRAHKEAKAAERIAQELEDRKERERLIKQRWRQKQYSKVFDGLKGFLSKGRFKYLTIGIMSGTIITSYGIWYFCHDGCRLFNPVPKQEEEYGHGH